MPKRKVEIEVSDVMLDEATKTRIKQLEKKITSLENKLTRREKKLQQYQQGMDISKERRERIRSLAEDLKCELQDSRWAEYDDYYDN